MRLPARLKRSKHGIYYFRLVIPAPLRAAIGKTELKKSLHTRDPKTAQQLAYTINAELAGRLQGVWKAMATDDDNPLGLPPHVLKTWTADIKKGQFSADTAADQRGLHSFLDNYLEKVSRAMNPDEAAAHAAKVKAFEALISKGFAKVATPPGINEIRFKEAMPKYAEHLASINNNKGTVTKYVAVAREFEKSVNPDSFVHTVTVNHILRFKEEQEQKKLSATTIDNKIISLSKFFKWAVSKLHYPNTDLPTKGQITLNKRQRKSLSQGYERFTFDELEIIFDPDKYSHATRRQPERFWLPILALFTGARIEELCQLHEADIKFRDGVSYLDINEYDDKNVKTEASVREVPLHPVLIRLGFLKYVDAVRSLRLGSKGVFPYLQPNKLGVLSSPASKQFNRYLKFVGIKTTRSKAFHSFRSTANQELTDRGVGLELRCHLVGHDLNNENIDSYRDKLPLKELKSAITKLKYEKEKSRGIKEVIDWNALHFDVSAAGKRVLELMKSVPAETARRSKIVTRGNRDKAGGGSKRGVRRIKI